jgi:hypothetical protein
MKRALVAALLAVALCAAAGCHRRKKAEPEAAAETGPRIASTVHLGDPKSAPQLIGGFYDIESGAWRWTGKQFTVELGVPFGAAQKGAALVLDLTVPPVVIEKGKSVTLAAAVDGNPLPPETYQTPGDYTYRREVPAALLGHDSVRVTFTLDKTVQAGGGDLRDLGIIATTVGLQAH